MGRLERILLLGLIVGVAACFSLAAYLDYCSLHDDGALRFCVVLGFVGAVLGMAAFVVVLRDLYLRSFPDPNAKMLWTLVILMTAGIGFFVYVLAHAMKPRNGNTEAIRPRDLPLSKSSSDDD